MAQNVVADSGPDSPAQQHQFGVHGPGDAVPCRIAGSTEENPVKGRLIIRAEDYSSR